MHTHADILQLFHGGFVLALGILELFKELLQLLLQHRDDVAQLSKARKKWFSASQRMSIDLLPSLTLCNLCMFQLKIGIGILLGALIPLLAQEKDLRDK